MARRSPSPITIDAIIAHLPMRDVLLVTWLRDRNWTPDQFAAFAEQHNSELVKAGLRLKGATRNDRAWVRINGYCFAYIRPAPQNRNASV